MLRFLKIDKETYPVGMVQTSNYPSSYLEAVSQTREWTGALHVTDLLNGARETYLKYTRDYAVDPDKRAFIVLGIGSHANMNDGAGRLKIKMNNIILTGEADYIEGKTLWDYKIAGSYKVAKAIGLKTRDVTVRDRFGNPEVYRSGRKAGQIKTKKEIYLDTPDPEAIEDYKHQLNIYRYMLKNNGVEIDELKIFFIVRDGGTISATSRGVMKNTYTINIPIMPDDEVKNFIIDRGYDLYNRLVDYFDKGIDNPPPMCSPKETWDGRKCENYCPVSNICREIGG